MIALGKGAEKEIDDILLTRYACYLIAQNGDSRKQERGEEIIAYCKQFEGTDKYDVAMLAIEFGYQLALKSE
jgi:hypothetical protein